MQARSSWFAATLIGLSAVAGCEASSPEAGGMTDDIGDPLSCLVKDQQFELDAQTPLGFSANDVLTLIGGRYRFPLQWSDPCADSDLCPSGATCPAPGSRGVPSVAGTNTFMTIEVRATGALAVADLPSEERQRCDSGMRVPVAVNIQSDDGAFIMQFEGNVYSESGSYASIGLRHQLREPSGASGSVFDELPAEPQLELGFGGGERDYWYFDMYLGDVRQPAPLLKGAVAGSCVGEGRRSKFVVP